MTKFVVSLALIALLSFAACLYLPWWSIAVVAWLVSVFIPQRPAAAFLAGFLSLLIFWSVFAFLISNSNHHLLAGKMSIIVFKADSPFGLIFVSGLIGALVAGFAALTGSYTRKRTARKPVERSTVQTVEPVAS